MLFSKKTLIATAAAAMISVSAFAGASLDSLLGGGSLFSSNGLLKFSDFQYDPILNAPTAVNIDVLALESGLRFGSPVSTSSNSGIVDFNISYKVTGVNALINSVSMKSTGSATGDGESGIFKTVENLANLTNKFTSASTLSSTSTTFSAQSEIYVYDDVFAVPNAGDAGISDFRQTFGTTTSGVTAVPSPTAALAGMGLLGVFVMRRRRGA